MTLLNKTECSALRGIAIIGIFMHNFLHWLRPMVKENEYQFHQSNVDGLLNILTNPDENLLWQLFSFFGHYGVPVFLFLSGYGLVLKYENGDKSQPGVLDFMWHHFRKLFPMMLLGFVCFAIVDWITPNRHHWSWLDVLTQLTMTINLRPDPDDIIWPGPYWFFGLIMQLYLFYRILLYKRHWAWTVVSVLVCWLIQAMCMDAPEGETLNRIRYNCIGGMLPFCMGIILARTKDKAALNEILAKSYIKVGWMLMSIAATVIVVCMSMTFHTWLWTPAFVVLFNVAVVKMLPSVCLKPLDWMGALSAAMFVCHPITRKVFIPISRGGELLDGLAIYVVATIMLAMLFRLAITELKKK